jgi:hypothetical protein
MTAFQIAEQMQSNEGLTRDWEFEPYRVEGLVAAGHPRSTDEARRLAGPPLGTKHLIRTDLIVLDKRLIRFVGPDKAHVMVIYGRPGRFGSGPRTGTDSRTEPVQHTLPIYIQRDIASATGVFPNYERRFRTIVRNITHRAEYRIADSNDKDEIIMQSSRLGGKVYFMNGLPYQYNGASVRELSGGQLQVVFWFRSASPVVGFSQGTFGNDISIPPLDVLQEYDIDERSIQPTIEVESPITMYGLINKLTGL